MAKKKIFCWACGAQQKKRHRGICPVCQERAHDARRWFPSQKGSGEEKYSVLGWQDAGRAHPDLGPI